jgi:hypothetical protein
MRRPCCSAFSSRHDAQPPGGAATATAALAAAASMVDEAAADGAAAGAGTDVATAAALPSSKPRSFSAPTDASQAARSSAREGVSICGVMQKQGARRATHRGACRCPAAARRRSPALRCSGSGLCRRCPRPAAAASSEVTGVMLPRSDRRAYHSRELESAVARAHEVHLVLVRLQRGAGGAEEADIRAAKKQEG